MGSVSIGHLFFHISAVNAVTVRAAAAAAI